VKDGELDPLLLASRFKMRGKEISIYVVDGWKDTFGEWVTMVVRKNRMLIGRIVS